MKLPEEELIDRYLAGEILDPTDYDQYALEKFNEFLGNDEDEA